MRRVSDNWLSQPRSVKAGSRRVRRRPAAVRIRPRPSIGSRRSQPCGVLKVPVADQPPRIGEPPCALRVISEVVRRDARETVPEGEEAVRLLGRRDVSRKRGGNANQEIRGLPRQGPTSRCCRRSDGHQVRPVASRTLQSSSILSIRAMSPIVPSPLPALGVTCTSRPSVTAEAIAGSSSGSLSCPSVITRRLGARAVYARCVPSEGRDTETPRLSGADPDSCADRCDPGQERGECWTLRVGA